jgi:uncharacterized protein YwgA
VNRLQKASIISALVARLREHGSWSGETHVQKATFFLQDAAGVPLDFTFILYKHGPFSFDLRDDLVSLRADGLFELEARPYPYGPSLVPTESGERVRDRFPKTLKRYEKQIEWVAVELGGHNVLELEQLSTALYVITRDADLSVDQAAQEIVALKPHISIETARAAVQEVRRFLDSNPYKA